MKKGAFSMLKVSSGSYFVCLFAYNAIQQMVSGDFGLAEIGNSSRHCVVLHIHKPSVVL